MDRRNFLQSQLRLLSLCGICSFQACRKERMSIDDQSQIIIDLEKELLTPGSWLRENEVLVIRLRVGFVPESFEAVQASCPHAGGNLEWNVQERQIICPIHGSRFSSSGQLLVGPAAIPLKRYSIQIREGRYLVVL